MSKRGNSGAGRSPYAKRRKRPYRYSDEYYAWLNAAKAGSNEHAIKHADAVWQRKFTTRIGEEMS